MSNERHAAPMLCARVGWTIVRDVAGGRVQSQNAVSRFGSLGQFHIWSFEMTLGRIPIHFFRLTVKQLIFRINESIYRMKGKYDLLHKEQVGVTLCKSTMFALAFRVQQHMGDTVQGEIRVGQGRHIL